jgi:myo-inositol-1(or 4)-monophosphatase
MSDHLSLHGDARSTWLLATQELAVRLVVEATKVHQARLDGDKTISTKSTATDLVSEVDRDCEALLVGILGRERPDDSILAEEMTVTQGSSGIRWVIDPLDGTVNYLHGYPAYGASVAVEVDGSIVAGAVSDSTNGTVYTAAKGFGATRSGRRLILPAPPDLASALVATGFSYDSRQRVEQAKVLARVIDHIGDTRRSGAAAYDLCQLAAGHVDAYYELDLGPWDYAAASLIVEEAGGAVMTPEAAHGQGPAVIAAHPSLISRLVHLLREAGALA